MFEKSWEKIPWLKKMFKLDKEIRPEKAFKVNTAQSSLNWYNSLMQFDLDRRRIYQDVEEMDTWFAVNSALDMYSEDAFPKDMDTDSMVWATSHNPKILSIAKKFLKDVIGDKLYSIVRSTAKYGCNNEQIIRTQDEIVVTKYIRPDLLTRIEDEYGRLRGFANGMLDCITIDGMQQAPPPKQEDQLSKPWDFIQFRIPSKTQREFIHGETMLQSARRLWRQCKIVLDSMVLYRWLRSPDRWTYYIDCTGQTPDQQFETINMWKNSLMKKERYDPLNNHFQNEFNPFSIDEDIFWPVTKDSPSKVEKHPTSNNVDDIADIKFLMGMFCSSLRIPKAYMGFDETQSPGAWVSKATLSQLDVRYARTIYKLQRSIMIGLSDMLKIHLALKGINPLSKENSFELHCAPVSYLDESERSELYKLRISMMNDLITLGQTLQFNEKWMDYIIWKFLKMPKSMLKKMKREEKPQQPAAEQNPNVSGDISGADSIQKTIMAQDEVPASGEGANKEVINSSINPYSSEFAISEDTFEIPNSIKEKLLKIGSKYEKEFGLIQSGIKMYESSISSRAQGVQSDINHILLDIK